MICPEAGSPGEARRKNKGMSCDRYSLKSLTDNRSALMGVATVIIMILHYYQILGVPFGGLAKSIVMFFAETCNFGVDIFLLLSGIGLYHSLEKEPGTLPFYKRRFLRILPEYALILCISAVPYHYSVSDVLRLFTGVNFWLTDNPTDWYMALLIVLYLIYPLLHRPVRSHSKTVIMIVCIAAVGLTALSVVMEVLYNKEVPRNIALARIPVFVAGALIGKRIKEEKAGINEKIYVALGLSAFVLIDIILVVTLNYTITRLIYGVCALTVALYAGTLLQRIPKENIFVKMMDKLGRISLPFYLLNMRIAIYMRSFQSFASLPGIVQIVISLIGTLLASILCQFICDKIRFVIRRFGNRKASVA